MRHETTIGGRIFKFIIYVVCILLAILSILPFVIMGVNATRSSPEIQESAISLIPSKHLLNNFRVFEDKSFNAWIGFINSMIVSVGSTFCAVYFSSLTAYALVAYEWRLRQPFFTFILAVMMIPAQVTSIGFYQFMYQIGWTNSFLPLIIPAIASPTVVFFMRQYLLGTLQIDIVNSEQRSFIYLIKL